jgi:uncharacterized protein YbjT (DUF2867 family)
MRALIAGASGFIGRRLAPELIERGATVRCLVRDPLGDAARELSALGCELRRADVTDAVSLEGVAADVDVAYYLVHLMEAGDGALGARERGSAGALARECRRAGVRQMIYLGGLGNAETSEHLESRQATADTLRSEGPPLTYFRAGMVVGAGSESYVLLRSLIDRLPGDLILTPSWMSNRTQPIGVDDVVDYLVEAAFLDAARGREIQLGGPEVMTYAEMLDAMAHALGEPPPRRVGAGGLSAKAAGRGAAAITSGNARVAELITAGLESDTVVTDPSGADLFGIEPDSLAIALARAIEDEAQAAEDAAG